MFLFVWVSSVNSILFAPVLFQTLHQDVEESDHQQTSEHFVSKRQVEEPKSFRQLSLPQIEIPFRDMASIVSEAEAAIVNRFEVLEPQIYNSNAR